MDFKLYISKNFIRDFIKFKKITGDNTSRTICCMISQFVKGNIDLHIPTIRKICLNNPDDVKRLRELLKEFG